MDPWLLMELDRLQSRLNKINGYRDEVEKLRFELKSIANASIIDGPMSMPMYQSTSEIERNIEALEHIAKSPVHSFQRADVDEEEVVEIVEKYSGKVIEYDEPEIEDDGDMRGDWVDETKEWQLGYIQALYDQGDRYLIYHNYVEARRLFKTINFFDKSYVEVWLKLAQCVPTYAESANCWREVLRLAPSNAVAIHEMSCYEEYMGNISEILSALKANVPDINDIEGCSNHSKLTKFLESISTTPLWEIDGKIDQLRMLFGE